MSKRFKFCTKSSVFCVLVGWVCAIVSTNATAADDTVVFAGWGGDWQEAERTHFFDSFEQETGIRVIDLPDLNVSKIKAMVDTNNVEWDVVQALDMWVANEDRAEKLFEKLDYSEINTEGIPEVLQAPHGVGVATFAMVLAYNTRVFKDKPHPTKWEDMWNFNEFAGKRGMLDKPRYALEVGLMGQGVSKDDLYPMRPSKIDRSLSQWRKIKDKVLWWDQWPQSISLLASGELSMTFTSQGRVLALLKKEPDAPISMVWNDGILTTDFLAIPKGSKRKENAQKLIAWMLDAKRQAEYAKATGVGPSNIKAFDYLNDETKNTLPSYHYERGELVAFDAGWWAVNQEQLNERWNKWKLQ